MTHLFQRCCPPWLDNRIYIGEHAAVAYAQDLLNENLPIVLSMAEFGVKTSVAPYLKKEQS